MSKNNKPIQNGKGSKPRKVDMDKYSRNYDAIFRKNKVDSNKKNK